MPQNIKDQVPKDNVKKLVKSYLSHLKDAGYSIFSGMPTIQVFPKKRNLIGIALKDDGNEELKYEFVDEPSRGDDYIFLTIEEIEIDFFLEELGEHLAFDKINFLQADIAYNTNLKRVGKLLESGLHAVALVFLVSAFENLTRDLFFDYYEIWFMDEDDEFDDEVYKRLGIRVDSATTISDSSYIVRGKEIQGVKYGIRHTDIDKARQWQRILDWEEIHKICKKLGVYEEYFYRKQLNYGKEIGNFEILKDILVKNKKKLNFQSVTHKRGMRKLYEFFFNIQFPDFEDTFAAIDRFMKLRNQIIHGDLKDEEITEGNILNFRNRIGKLVSYLRDHLGRKYANKKLGVWSR